MGLFKKGKSATFAGAICNLTLSVLGVRIYGIYGVLAATVISQLIIWIGDYIIILNDYYSDEHYKRTYLLSQLEYFAVVMIAAILSLLAVNSIELRSPLLHFIAGGIVSECIYMTLFIFRFHGKEEYHYLIGIGRRVYYRLLHRSGTDAT